MPKTKIQARTTIEEALADYVIKRYRNVLAEGGIENVMQLTAKSEEELVALGQIGSGVLEQIKDFMTDKDLHYGMTREDWIAYDPDSFASDEQLLAKRGVRPAAMPILGEPVETTLPLPKGPVPPAPVVMEWDLNCAAAIRGIIASCRIINMFNMKQPETAKALSELQNDPSVQILLGR